MDKCNLICIKTSGVYILILLYKSCFNISCQIKLFFLVINQNNKFILYFRIQISLTF